MTREELDSYGEAIAADEAEPRDVELAIQAERQIAAAALGADDPIGPEPEPVFFENMWHVRGRYYANAADADFWRALYAEQRCRTVARIARLEAAHAAGGTVTPSHAA